MKTYTGSLKNGTGFKGIYTSSTMPNQKLKRTRKSSVIENDTQTFKFNFNLMGLFGSALVYFYAPLPLGWKLGIMGMLLFSACHAEVE